MTYVCAGEHVLWLSLQLRTYEAFIVGDFSFIYFTVSSMIKQSFRQFFKQRLALLSFEMVFELVRFISIFLIIVLVQKPGLFIDFLVTASIAIHLHVINAGITPNIA